MPKASALQFHNYRVEELMFRSTPVSDDQREFELNPQIEHKVVELGDDRYDINLSIAIYSTEERPMPFELKVSLVGQFTFCDEESGIPEQTKKIILRENTVSILFPFLRSTVASLTTSANIPTLVLPIMNFASED